MNVTRDHAVVFFGASTVLVGIWLVLAPETFPALDLVAPVSDRSTAGTVGIALGIGVLGVALVRLWKKTVALDRSPITETPPEAVTNAQVTKATAPLDSTYDGLHTRFDTPGRAERHVAMYGRRAEATANLSGEIGQFLDELAVTARDVYATATGCDVATAEDAIASGSWTDDRVAAAFLAVDAEQAPTFTTSERLLAWLMPRWVFEKRLDRVIAAVEAQADVYLTYDSSSASVEEGD